MLRRSHLSAPLAAAILCGAAASAHATPVYDNLSLSTDQSDPVFGNDPLAQSFNAGNGGALTSVQLRLTDGSTINPSGALQVSLLADNGGAPGVTVATIGSIINSAIPIGGFADIGLAPTAPIVLGYGTTYWLAITESTPNGIAWAMSNDVSGPGVAGQFASDQSLGVTPAAAGGAFQMRIDVPEPASAAVLGCAVFVAVRRRRRPA